MDQNINNSENLSGRGHFFIFNCMNELKDKAEIPIPKLPPEGLLKKLKALNINISKNKNSGNREFEYIYVYRFIQVFNCLAKQTNNKKFLDSKLHAYVELTKKYLDRMTTLQNALEKIYELKKKESQLNVQNSSNRLESTNSNEINSIEMKNGKEASTPQLQDPPLGNFIKCSQLYSLITKLKSGKNKNILIIDVRSSEDFSLSHVGKLETMNIPSEMIQKGKSAARIGKEINKEFSQHWRERQNYEIIVLVDWRSKEKDSNQDSEIYILKDIMINWDPGTKYKSICILDGGFEELLNQYPLVVTNPKVAPPYVSNNSFDQDLLNKFEYPMDMLEPPRVIKPVVIQPQAQIPDPADKRLPAESIEPLAVTKPTKVYPSFTRKNKPVSFNQCAEFINKESQESKSKKESGEGDFLKSVPSIVDGEGSDDMETANDSEADVSQIEENKEKEERESSEKPSDKDLKLLIDDLRKVKPSGLSSTSNKIINNDETRQPPREETVPQENWDSSDDDWCSKEVPLKDETSGGGGPSSNLKRSLSSPNIAQIKDDELTARPSFSRATKPSSSQRPLTTTLMFGERTDATYGKTTLGLTGLKNFANNCYMNSILQCLSNTEELVKELIHLNKPALNPNSKTKGEIANGVITALRCIWSGELKVYSIRDLKTVMGNYQEIFSGANHQDSHEFLIILLEYLHDDLNIPVENTNLVGAVEESGEKAWGEFKRKNCSVIQRLFYGQDRSSVTCSTCSHTSVTFGQFFNLFVPIPEYCDRATLEECIQLYMRGERITGWHCPKCRCSRTATKKMDLTRLPPILIIALKRFSQEGQSSWLEKKENLVTYPLEDLDMSRFIVPESEQRYTKYNLHALSLHSGTLRSGHYRAICKSSVTQKWYIYDDAMITSISPNEVRSNPDVYILFYHAVK